jgi:nucleotide-binding universal stress UspA family protein
MAARSLKISAQPLIEHLAGQGTGARAALARRLEVSHQAVSAWLKGAVPAALLPQIAEAMGISVEAYLTAAGAPVFSIDRTLKPALLYKRVLIALDASPASGAVAKYGIRLAAVQGAATRLVHVVNERRSATPKKAVAGRSRIANEGSSVLSAAHRYAVRHGVRSRSILREVQRRPATDLILKEAELWRPDVIVIGAHDATAHAVARRAGIPVLLVGSTR